MTAPLPHSAVRLTCPRDSSVLTPQGDAALGCALGHCYPVVDGIPVLLLNDVPQTMALARASLARAANLPGSVDERNPDLFLESLGISEEEKQMAIALAAEGGSVDPVVSVIIGATNGYAYKDLIGRLKTYPIPELPLPPGNGRVLLDIGCNWGRWCVAAARKGYRVVGIDPSLGAVMAARRVTRQLGLDITYVVGDGRYLPFSDDSFDSVFSYSVLQHFDRSDALRVVSEAARTLRPAGTCLIQMAHALGPRSLFHQLRRGFRPRSEFDVRYWTIPRLRQAFEERVGPSGVRVHSYFGLGLEPSDQSLLPRRATWAIAVSEGLRALSDRVPALTFLADSVYVSAVKTA